MRRLEIPAFAGKAFLRRNKMNLLQNTRAQILNILEALTKEGLLPAGISFDAVEATLPREASHGDLATNAAMVLAGKAGMKPRDIAELLLPHLQNLPHIEMVEIAGPGFINLRFSPAFWQEVIPAVIKEGREYGTSTVGKGVKVNVEYVSANPTGPIHIGHTRGAVFGDALCGLLKKAGYEVTKEYYINDAGSQIDKLVGSAHLRYREALGEKIEIPDGYYPGDYLIPVGQALAKNFGDKYKSSEIKDYYSAFRPIVLEAMMNLIREDLALMGIHHDLFTSEQAVRDAGLVEKALDTLDQKGLIYTGVLEPPKGKAPEDWEPRPQTLFKATEFGDDLDRAIKKSDGSWTYFAPDIAYHKDKCDRGFDVLIDVLGADHGGYVKRLKAVVKALTGDKVQMDVKLCQMVKFLRDGQPAKMSKRAGTFVTARDVVEEAGKDVLRFIMLTRKNDAPLDFDFAKVLEQSKDNPVFYVQYAHARCRSVLRNAGDKKPDASLFAHLKHASEIDLIKQIALWPNLVEQAARAHEPHRIAFYLHDLAAAFHALWNVGNSDIESRFIVESPQLTAARLALVQATATTIASGLNVLGVEPVEEMRG